MQRAQPLPFCESRTSTDIIFDLFIFTWRVRGRKGFLQANTFSSWPAQAFLYKEQQPRDVGSRGARCSPRPLLVRGQCSIRVWDMHLSLGCLTLPTHPYPLWFCTLLCRAMRLLCWENAPCSDPQSLIPALIHKALTAPFPCHPFLLSWPQSTASEGISHH